MKLQYVVALLASAANVNAMFDRSCRDCNLSVRSNPYKVMLFCECDMHNGKDGKPSTFRNSSMDVNNCITNRDMALEGASDGHFTESCVDDILRRLKETDKHGYTNSSTLQGWMLYAKCGKKNMTMPPLRLEQYIDNRWGWLWCYNSRGSKRRGRSTPVTLPYEGDAQDGPGKRSPQEAEEGDE